MPLNTDTCVCHLYSGNYNKKVRRSLGGNGGLGARRCPGIPDIALSFSYQRILIAGFQGAAIGLVDPSAYRGREFTTRVVSTLMV